MLSIFSLSSFFGVALLIGKVGIIGNQHSNIKFDHSCQIKNDEGVWERDPENNPVILYQSLAGVIMLGVLLAPMLMRPFDFLNNFSSYTVGLLSYMLLMPFFNTILQVYGYCNLHDVSWGNRPALSGASTAKKQSEENYKQSRIMMVFFWVVCNMAYCIALDIFISKPK